MARARDGAGPVPGCPAEQDARTDPLLGTDYDWRQAESRLNALTDPTAHGGAAQDAFHVVIPSLPGYGFSARPQAAGWNPDRIARAWDELMRRLGYTRYVAQGGDWGAAVTEVMGRQAPPGLAGIHVNLPATVPPDVEAALAGIGPVPEMTEQERATFEALAAYRKSGSSGYFAALTTRPQAVGYGLTVCSPAGGSQWDFITCPFDGYAILPSTLAVQAIRSRP